MSATATSALDIPLHVTFFASAAADDKRERTETLRSLAKHATTINAPSKGQLLWVKLAKFGDARTSEGSLRHNANMLSVSGVEGDYDDGDMTPETAAEILRSANIAALIYTSPGHHTTGDDGEYKGERWRVVCPLASEHTPENRERFLARVNGALGGVLAGESFAKSQSYYIGGVGGAKPQTILVDGRPLDMAADLDDIAVGKRGGGDPLPKIELPAGMNPDDKSLAALEAACALFEDPKGDRHQRILVATNAVARFIARGLLDQDACEEAIAKAMTDSGREPNTGEIKHALDRALEHAQKVTEQRAKEAYSDGSEFRDDPLPEVAPITEADDAAPLVYAFGENPYGARRWLVHQMLPEIGVALLSGQWGIGKTFTAIELAVCAMFGTSFARHTVDRQCGVLWLAAEGEAEISDRLQAAIDAKPEAAGRPVPFVWADTFPLLLAHDAVKQFERIIGAARARLDQMGATLGLIVLDTMAAGAGWDNENDAAEGQKAMNLLRKIARHYGCLVVGIDHYGKDSGSGTRGTTAKEAAADAVLALIGDRQPSGKIVNSRMAVRKARGGIAGREYPFGLPWGKIGVDGHGRDITTCTVAWTERVAQSDATEKQPEPKHVDWHAALQTILASNGDTTTMDAWCARIGLAEVIEPGDNRTERKRKRAGFHNAKSALVTAKWVAVDSDSVSDMRPDQSLADLTA